MFSSSKCQQFKRSVNVPVSASMLWDWHMRKGAFQRLSPPWEKMEILRLPQPMEEGAEAVFKIHKGPFSKIWRAKIEECNQGHCFVDTQIDGPFAYWRHEHTMASDGDSNSELIDKVTLRLPAGMSHLSVARRAAERELDRLFHFRHRRMIRDLERYSGTLPGEGKTILITGSTGLIGTRLAPFLETLGYEIRGLTRGKGGVGLFRWEPSRGWIDPAALEGVTAVIHLAGENIASGRWSKNRRQRILRSRIEGTRTLVDAINGMKNPPEVLISSSGVNYYESGSGEQTEQSSMGNGFLAEVCEQWEAEALRAKSLGVRTICLRTGVVLDPSGGALGKMLPAFNWGLGGAIGSGDQGLPWIGMEDLLDVFVWLMDKPGIEGPVNAVHPEMVTQKDFSGCLGRILRRPTFFPLPAFMVKLLFGQMGVETLLADLKVSPTVLLESGFKFSSASLRQTLGDLLGLSAMTKTK